mmetsp:Transcript_7682/g.12905  ORF Transcript_7682/g.12905 Transcript_7682/m.12905 type:complete len:637 (+) Transcript_7682:3-1913(+)
MRSGKDVKKVMKGLLLGSEVLLDGFNDILAGLGDGSSRAKDAVDTVVIEELVILVGNDTSTDEDHVGDTLCLEFLDELRDQRLVSSSLTTDADGVHISVDSLASNFLGGLEKRSNVDVKAEISKTSGDDLLATIVTVLAHLGDEETRTTTKLFSKAVDAVNDRGDVVLGAVLTGISSTDETVVRSVTTPLGTHLEGLGDLTDSGTETSSFDGELEEVGAFATSTVDISSSHGQFLEGSLDGSFVSGGLDLGEQVDLLLAHSRVVDLEGRDLGLLVGRDTVLVDTDDDLITRVDVGLATGSRLFDPELGHSTGDGLGHATEGLDLLDDLEGAGLELVGEGLHHVGSSPGVDDLGEVGLSLEDELRVSGDARRVECGQTDSFVEGVGVEGLGASENGSHGLDGGADDVVVRVLLSERPSTGLAVGAKEEGLCGLGLEVGLDELCPETTSGPELGDLDVKVHANAKEEGEAGGNVIDADSGLETSADVFETVSDGEGELERGVGSSLLHVVTTDRDAVVLWHLLGGERHDVLDDPHRFLGRVDEGVADHELLEDIVLDRSLELFVGAALFLRSDDVHGEHREHCTIHGHRDGDILERDTIKEDLHVLDAVDGDTSHTDVSLDTGVVRVVTTVRGEIKGD